VWDAIARVLEIQRDERDVVMFDDVGLELRSKNVHLPVYVSEDPRPGLSSFRLS
jgi:hypothetical protein